MIKLFSLGILADLIAGTGLGFSSGYFLMSGMILEKIKNRLFLVMGFLVLFFVYGRLQNCFY